MRPAALRAVTATLFLASSLLPIALAAPASDSGSSSKPPAADSSHDYIVIGTGAGGGPLAANLAKKGYTVLLLEAGDDQTGNINEQAPAFQGRSAEDPTMRWDFFVKHSDDAARDKSYSRYAYRTVNGTFYVGLNPPAGATALGVYYPRSGTLGGCTSHNAFLSVLPTDSDWDYIAELTGDKSWKATNMLQYFTRMEKNYYLPKGTPGHGFDGWLDITQPNPHVLDTQNQFRSIVETAAGQFGTPPEKLYDVLQKDINYADPKRDSTPGMFGFATHLDTKGHRFSTGTYIKRVLAEKNADGTQKYPLTLQLNALATRVLFDSSSKSNEKKLPRATGVEYLSGKSLYRGDPRWATSNSTSTLKTALAKKEVIIAGGAFNTPQILKLSGIGPATELRQFNISVLVDSPGVGVNLQDHYETGITGLAAQNLTNTAAANCTNGAPGDPCLVLFEQGLPPYTAAATNAIRLRTSVADTSDHDIFMWSVARSFTGFWPGFSTAVTPRSTATFAMLKMHPRNRAGTVTLRSADPREMPEVNFRFFNDSNSDKDLRALAEGVSWARKVFSLVPSPVGPVKEDEPCNAAKNGAACAVGTRKVEEDMDAIKREAYSHHASSSAAIGKDGDRLAVLDSEFRVRGTLGLRVVDASAFPRVPGAFPVIPTLMLSEKATDLIAGDAKKW